MFAGAAREAVFSNPDVIRRVNADFVPLALKAALVNDPPDDEEGRLYREIGRSKPAPQGICVANSAGKVLAWALMFDDDKSVLAFLEHTAKRFAEYPDANRPVAAERYMKFPSRKLHDVEDTGTARLIPERHANGQACPGQPRLLQGTVTARLFGRALDKDGKPVADTARQEHYVEDRFNLPAELQDNLARALAGAATGHVRVPRELAELWATHAHLGHIDVRPLLCLNPAAQNKGEWKRCEFWAEKAASSQRRLQEGETVLWRIDGESEVVSELAINGSGVHNVKLTWEGFIEMNGTRMARLLLAARGTEKLEFAKDDHPLKREKCDEVACLPAGRPIDLACGVRYGIIGEPVP